MNVAGGTMIYAARQLGNGLSPAEARTVALEVGGGAGRDRRRPPAPDPACPARERRALARQLAAMGWTTRQIAARHRGVRADDEGLRGGPVAAVPGVLSPRPQRREPWRACCTA